MSNVNSVNNSLDSSILAQLLLQEQLDAAAASNQPESENSSLNESASFH